MTRPTPASLRGEANSRRAVKIRGMARRMRVIVGKGVRWALEGAEYPDGQKETDSAEVFSGPMLYRPKDRSGRVEAVAVAIGGESGHRAIIATRDQALIKALEDAIGDLGDDDETILANSQVMMRLSKAGKVLLSSLGGSTGPLATKEDLEALRDVIIAWSPAPSDGGAALKTDLLDLFSGPPTWPAGTSKVEAE